MTDLDSIRAEAIDWLIRMRDGDVAEWEALTVWLEADPRHVRAYDDIVLADADFDESARIAPQFGAANDDVRKSARQIGRRVWVAGFGAIAAALVAVVGIPALYSGQERYVIVSKAGEHRKIGLADGTQIALNGSSRITLDRNDLRFASLDEGEALFSVKHDAARPFAVIVGDNRIQDVGTVFNVLRQAKSLTVEVAEGAVLFNPDREAIPLKAGQTLKDAGSGDTVVVGTKIPAAIGTWREGRLIYQNALLSTVADDLSRNVGVIVLIDPEIAARQFTGVIQVERNPKTLFARLSSVLGVDVRQTAKGWKISMRGRAAQ